MGIKELTFLDDVELIYIGKNAFACNNIKILSLSHTIEYIDDNAFANNNITDIIDIHLFYTIKWGKNVFNNNNINMRYNIKKIIDKRSEIKDPKKVITYFNEEIISTEIFGNQTIK
jgi:hypothetical protein